MIGIVIIGAISLVNAIFLYLLYKTVTHKFADYDHKFSQMKIENELELAMSEQDQDKKEFNIIVRELFERVKIKFNLTKVSSYSEMVEEIKVSPKIDSTLKKVLIDFFERVMVLEYKDNSLKADEKSELKKELKIILERFN